MCTADGTRKREGSRRRSLSLRGLAVVALVLVILAAGVAGGVLLDRQVLVTSVPTSNLPAAASPEFKLMAEAWNSIQQNYVDHAAAISRTLTYGAISGMVEALGDTGHSRFLSPEMVQEEAKFTQGELDGIGAEVAKKDGWVVIVAPIDGSPAQQAGLHAGEAILKVDDRDVGDLPLESVVQLIIGQPGTQVKLSILDPASGHIQDMTLQRAHIAIQNVTWQRLPGTSIAHVRVAAFSQGVSANLRKALAAIKAQGCTGIILDLRDDPGGLLEEAIATASQFVASGNVLLERDAQAEITQVPARNGGAALDIPMVVLVNQGTASAAEIVSGALQDAHRATLVGEVTFGTGTVLNQFGLSDGSAMLLATQEWLTPNGREIWHKGITPDVPVTLAPGVSPLLPEQERTMAQPDVSSSGDQQLLKALQLLAQSTAEQVP
jgi:carboxyl-terminal processing protease